MGIRFFVVLFLVSGSSALAQTPVAPTPETVGPVKGNDWDGYNLVNSFETGYRLLSVSGNLDKYRSDENFGNGVRLLSSFFSVNSKDGKGHYLDEFLLTTEGLGGDPYESVRLKMSKNRLYEYNFSWRKNDYFNPGLTTDGQQGLHLLDTSYTLQDHDLTLFPQSRIRVFLGYTRSAQNGAGISSLQLFNTTGPSDPTGDIFPVFTNVKRGQNEYRLGAELHWLGFTLNVLHGWEDFKDDTPFSRSGSVPGDLNNGATLTSFYRSEPNHGTSPYWQVALFRNVGIVSIDGRFTYTGGFRAFLTSETAFGVNQLGVLANQQIFTSGNARRPVATGNLNVTVQPTSKFTLTSRTSVYNVRTEGNSQYLQFDNATQSSELLYFQYLGIRTVETDLNAQYQASNWLSIDGGYNFSNRRIGSSPQFAFAGVTSGVPYIQTNTLNAGSAGVRLRPIKGLTISLRGELGRADNPFTPKSDKDYNSLSARVQYKWKTLQLSAQSKSDYNLNSISVTSYASHARTYSGSVAWSPRSWVSFDASYSKLHVDTLGGIAFFANSQLFNDQFSYYISNLHTGVFAARFSTKRADFYVGYSRVQDVGDGRGAATSTVIGPNLVPFQTAQSFPLTFQSPMARVSIKLTERFRWNIGYQYFGYHEVFSAGENYLAHTAYTSALWSF